MVLMNCSFFQVKSIDVHLCVMIPFVDSELGLEQKMRTKGQTCGRTYGRTKRWLCVFHSPSLTTRTKDNYSTEGSVNTYLFSKHIRSMSLLTTKTFQELMTSPFDTLTHHLDTVREIYVRCWQSPLYCSYSTAYLNMTATH